MIFHYPDNPPGTTGLDYTYELWKNKQTIVNTLAQMGLSGVIINEENDPNGDNGYDQPSRDL